MSKPRPRAKRVFSALAPSAATTPKPTPARRASLSDPRPKAQRTSKTNQKLVLLPSAPQTRPLADDGGGSGSEHGYETDAGHIRAQKSIAERLTKAARARAGYPRIAAYCVADGLDMPLLAGYLRREHNVAPRAFDDALYAMYHLPLLPGYGPSSNIRSSAAPAARIARLDEAEERGYQGAYFDASHSTPKDGYFPSSPTEARHGDDGPSRHAEETEDELEHEAKQGTEVKTPAPVEPEAEAIFFPYGVVVFFGLTEANERAMLEDVFLAGAATRPLSEDDWETEECHYSYDPNIIHPRIYNDFFSVYATTSVVETLFDLFLAFKAPSHLLHLSVAHALAQSTLLARHEARAESALSDPRTKHISAQLAHQGHLKMRRSDALKLTGRLFKIRADVSLSPVLSVPALFWSEASLGGLYDGVRSYLELDQRGASLDARLADAAAFLDNVHEQLNEKRMDEITWIVIWLIVAAILVELGEVVARLIVHATTVGRTDSIPIGREEALNILDRIASGRT